MFKSLLLSVEGLHRSRKKGLQTGARLVHRRFILDISAASEVTTDATFRYRNFTWRTSAGERHPFEYIIAQQPAGGATARDALSAVEETLPKPPSGWTLILIPSVSLVCSGKEEMRPLASLLSQRGHRCYILEWPGWTQDVQVNWSLEHCKAEHLAEEYQDFWCQALEHVAHQECEEEEQPPKLCVVAAGLAGIYSMRALKAISMWEPTKAKAELYKSLVMLAPSWQAPSCKTWLSRLGQARAASWTGAFLHSDSRLGRIYRRSHFSLSNLRRHFPHTGAGDEDRLFQLASWFFQRPRPYAQTDAMIMYGFLDPPAENVDALADEIKDSMSRLQMLLLMESKDEAMTLWEALKDSGVEHRPASSHELAPSAVQFAVDEWLTAKG